VEHPFINHWPPEEANIRIFFDGRMTGLNIYEGWLYAIDTGDNRQIKKAPAEATSNDDFVPFVLADGTVLSDPVRALSVVDGWIYYVNIDVHRIYRVRTDGTGRERLSNTNSRMPNVSGGWLYYIEGENVTSGTGNLRKMRVDGTQDQLLWERGDNPAIFTVIPHGEWLYLLLGQQFIRRIHIDGTGFQPFFEDDRQARAFNVFGDRLYYSNVADNGLYSVRLDGTNTIRYHRRDGEYVTSPTTGGIVVTEDWVFYRSSLGALLQITPKSGVWW
jgi:hypothetical protein